MSHELEIFTERYNIPDVEADLVDEERILELKEKAKDPEYREYIRFMREYYHYLVPGFERVLEIGELNKELREKHYQRTIKGVDIEVASDRLSSFQDKIFIVTLCSIVGSFVGLNMSILGFLLWYFRVQKYHDLKLVADAIEKR